MGRRPGGVRCTVFVPKTVSEGALNRSLLRGVWPADRSRIPTELIAGLTLAAICIPQAIGYTRIAGMPVVTGLYTILIPLALFAIFGSSRQLIVGADSASAAILAAGLVSVAAAGSPQYVALASTMALLIGLLLLLSRLLRMGFLADFMSRTVMIGLLTGVGLDIAIGEISGMVGLSSTSGSTVAKLIDVLPRLPDLSMLAVVISMVVIASAWTMARISKRAPSMLVILVGAIVVSWALDLQGHGVVIIGAVQGGLPAIGLPQLPDPQAVLRVLPTLFSLFIVIITQSTALSRDYAIKSKEETDENRDILGLGLANLGAGLSGTFVVNGGVSQTEVAYSMGARTKLASLTTVAMVLLVILFLTVPLSFLPVAVLSAMVFVIGVGMIDVRGMRELYRKSRAEFAIALATVLSATVLGVGGAAVFAMVVSLLYHVQMGYRTQNSVMVIDEHRHVRPVPLSSSRPILPGLVIYRFNHGMYYANSHRLYTEAMKLVRETEPPIAWLCIDFSAVSYIDVSSGMTLRRLHGELGSKGVRLVFVDVSQQVRRKLDRFGVASEVSPSNIFGEVSSVLDAFQQSRFNEHEIEISSDGQGAIDY